MQKIGIVFNPGTNPPSIAHIKADREEVAAAGFLIDGTFAHVVDVARPEPVLDAREQKTRKNMCRTGVGGVVGLIILTAVISASKDPAPLVAANVFAVAGCGGSFVFAADCRYRSQFHSFWNGRFIDYSYKPSHLFLKDVLAITFFVVVSYIFSSGVLAIGSDYAASAIHGVILIPAAAFLGLSILGRSLEKWRCPSTGPRTTREQVREMADLEGYARLPIYPGPGGMV